MKIKHKTHQKSIWIIAALSSIVIIGLLIMYFVFANNGTLNPTRKTSDDNKSSTSSSDSTQQDERSPTEKITPPNTDHAAPITTDESTGKQIFPMVVSATVDGTIVYIRGGLNIPVTEGTCHAELTGPNGESIRKDTILLPNAGTTDCKTISVPISELSYGKWNVTLNYMSDTSEGTSSAASFTIK